MNDNIKTLLKFMPVSQSILFIKGLHGSEKRYFESIATKISKIITIILPVHQKSITKRVTIFPKHYIHFTRLHIMADLKFNIVYDSKHAPDAEKPGLSQI